MFKQILAGLGLMLLAACGQQSGGGENSGGSSGITGAGATFPAPIYAKWGEAFQQGGNGSLNYQPIGSGGGIKQITANTVDFGASDKPLSSAELDKAGLFQFPAVIGGVVPVINAPGIESGKVRLSGELLGDIFLGKIKLWNAPEIKALNPDVNLPQLPITVVHRSDGSGTTFLFTSYLMRKNAEWESKVGANDAVKWPTGLGGKGNDGVSAFVRQTTGAIGYVEYAYAKQNGLAYVLLSNHDGQFIAPTAEAFAAAAEGAPWGQDPSNAVLLVDQPGANSWPISGASFILVYKAPKDAAAAQNVLKFFDWAFANGDPAAMELDYVPLPQKVKDVVREQWAKFIQVDGKPVYQP